MIYKHPSQCSEYNKSLWGRGYYCLEIVLILIVLLTGLCTTALAQEKKSDIFTISTAATFSWYLDTSFSKLTEEEKKAEEKRQTSSTETKFDRNNFGISVMMNLKLYDMIGAGLILKIDDPTFQKMVEVAGYVTAYYFLLKFDYHNFGGTVTWTGDTPNPIPGEVYNFSNRWTIVSLLFRFDQLQLTPQRTKKVGNCWVDVGNCLLSVPQLLLWAFGSPAIGIGYARIDMPLEYQVKSDSGLSYPGFGLLKGEVWGFSALWDSLTLNMEQSASNRSIWWIYLDGFIGFGRYPIGKVETDVQAIAWMSNANGSVPVNGDIKRKTSFFSLKMIVGLQYVWDVGEKGRIGLALGFEMLNENFGGHNDDIDIGYSADSYGPAVRISALW